MNKHFLWILLMLLIDRPAQAVLGETEAELQARYGRSIVIKTDDPANYMTRAYHNADYQIQVTFVDGKSQQETYWAAGALTDIQIADLLALDALGSKWTETQHKAEGED